MVVKVEKEFCGIINISENILKLLDVIFIMIYEFRNDNFRNNLKKIDLLCLNFLFGLIIWEKVLEMFGGLKM